MTVLYDVGDIATITAVLERLGGDDFDDEDVEVTCHVVVSNGDASDPVPTFIGKTGHFGTYEAEVRILVDGATYWAIWTSVGDPAWSERQTFYSKRAVSP